MSVVKMFVQALRKFPLTMFLRLTHGKHSVNYYVVVVVVSVEIIKIQLKVFLSFQPVVFREGFSFPKVGGCGISVNPG